MNNYEYENEEAIIGQPLLPQVSMVWFFIVTAVIAAALVVLQWVGRGRALIEAVGFTLVFCLVFGLFSAITFLIAFVVGALRRVTFDRREVPESPFVDGRLPDQVIPPRRSDAM